MGRKEKETTDLKAIKEIIAKATVCRIGLCANGEPYVFPVNYGYHDGCLYFHSAPQGRKIDMIRKNPRVCFQMDVDREILPAEKACDWSVKYRSVIGFGKAELLQGPDEKRHALRSIMSHYSDRKFAFKEESLVSVCIICIHIEQMTGKISGY